MAEQPPLKICYPSPEEDKSFRRSSRFTTNIYKTPSPKSSSSSIRTKAPPALVVSQLRKSPRFSAPSSAPALTLTDGENVGFGEVGPRKRCRLKKAKLGPSEGSLRRSLRLSGGVIANSNLQLINLPEPGSRSSGKGCLSVKCLRSRTVLAYVGDEKAKTDKICTNKDGGEFSTNEKCLRSRRVESALIESAEASEKRAERREVRSLRSRTVELHLGSKKKKAYSNSSKKNAVDLSENGANLRSYETEYGSIEWRGDQKMGKEVIGIKMVALPEISTSSGKKCLALDESVDVSEESDEGKCEVLSEKSLRSRKVQVKVKPEELESKKKEKNIVCCFVGEPIPEEVAQKRWQWRYDLKVVDY